MSNLCVKNAVGETLPIVTIATAESVKVSDRIPISGTFVARQEIHINAQLSGLQIKKIHVQIGDKVEQGDALIELDSQVLENELSQIDAQVARAEAGIRQAQNRIAVAEAAVGVAKSDLERSTQLQKSHDVSQSTMDISVGEAEQAAALRAVADEELAIAYAEQAQWHARRAQATLNLSRAMITAPANGLITASTVHVGAMLTPGDEPLLSLMVNSEIELEAEVMATALSRVRVGDRAKVLLSDGRSQDGEIRLISPRVDPRTRLGMVKVSLVDPTNIRIGTFAHGRLDTGEYEALVIPDSAVQSSVHGDSVMVVNEGVIERRRVVSGIVDRGRREILQGLSQGEYVLQRAGNFYADGDRVSVMEPVSNTVDIPIKAARWHASGDAL